LSITLSGRADARALAGAAVLGSLVALAIGGAYLAGGLARAAVVRDQISRIAAVSDGFSETALTRSSTQDLGALAIARRHDPFKGTEPEASERRLVAYADQLQARFDQAPSGGLMQASLTKPRREVVAARPFHLRDALDQTRDLECLTQAVYYEARGESRAGQAAVAQVVLNRTRHPAFPKSVCGVVFQRLRGTCQFSFACDGSVHRRVELGAWRRAEQVAARALDGSVMSEVGNATHFHVARISPIWRNSLLRVSQVGSHVFYRFGGRAGSAKSFTASPEPSPLPAATPDVQDNQPVYASLSLAPLANTVASTMANSVATTVAAGAGLVAAATKPLVETSKPLAIPPIGRPPKTAAAMKVEEPAESPPTAAS
jgi:spore germination cell wall hydrolase CwlJ-like protein